MRSCTRCVTRIAPEAAADCARAATFTTVPMAVRSRWERPNSPNFMMPESIPIPTPSDRASRPCARENSAKRLLQEARRRHGAGSMVGVPYREIEYRHDGIADRLVQQTVLGPYGVATSVVEGVEQFGHRLRRQGFGQPGVAAQVGEHHRGINVYVAGPHDRGEGQFAKCAGIGVHSTRL